VNKLYKVLVAAAVMMLVVVLASCASETPETQKLYTDAKQMWDDLNKGFSLPKGQERITLMNKVLDEEWDVKIVANLEKYLKDAPSGKYASEAKTLLDQAQKSDYLRMLGQARPMMKMLGDQPKTVQEVDSLTKQPVAADSTK
jgi:hypothetical protein